MQVIDTHCHIHDPVFNSKYEKPIDTIIADAKAAGVDTFICVGTDAVSSQQAVSFAKTHAQYASVAIHPHEVAEQSDETINKGMRIVAELAQARDKEVVAIGECGLDYYYHEDKTIREQQKKLLRQHLEVAHEESLPLIFHIRNAFEDFFEIIDDYADKGVTFRGVIHSFTAHQPELEGCLKRGFYVGLNGIMTFTKDDKQLAAAQAVPLERMMLETDAPFLTPKPYRGKMCELHHILLTAHFLSEVRGEDVETLVAATTANARNLFNL